MTDPRLVDPAVIHLALGIPPSTLSRWASEGRLAHHTQGYDLEEVAELFTLMRSIGRVNLRYRRIGITMPEGRTIPPNPHDEASASAVTDPRRGPTD